MVRFNQITSEDVEIIFHHLKHYYNVAILKISPITIFIAGVIWNRLSLRNVLWVVGVCFVAFYMYYELGLVGPVCPYYSQKLLARQLNTFQTIAKTYRPTIYLFSPKLQWLYFNLFCRLTGRLVKGRVTIIKRGFFLKKITSHIKSTFYGILLNTWPFRKIYKAQANISLREAVEGHNESLVILDWYLPHWTVKHCETCGKTKRNNDANVVPEWKDSGERPGATDGQIIARNNNGGKSDKAAVCIKTEHDASTNAKSITSDTPHVIPTRESVQSVNTENVMDLIYGDAAYYHLSDDDAAPNESVDVTSVEIMPTPKIIRGVVIIVSDLNVSYNICSQPVVCLCDSAHVNEDSHCKNCISTHVIDHDGLNELPPGMPELLCFIDEANTLGFVCVHVHLNVNLGMATEAFPKTTGLRSFPFSLYGDTVLDVDAAIRTVSQRYPHTPMVGLGIGYGGNVLLEYLCTGTRGRNAPASAETELDFDGMSHQRSQAFKRDSSTQMQTADFNDQSLPHEAADTAAQNGSIGGKAAITNGRIDGVINTAPPKDIVTSVTEEHFKRQNADATRVETGVIFPPPKARDNESIPCPLSAVAVVNANLSPGNFLFHDPPGLPYDIRKSSSCYINYCLESLRRELKALLFACHCARKIKYSGGECRRRDCCHFRAHVAASSFLKRCLLRLRFRPRSRVVSSRDSLDRILELIHREYTSAYKELKRGGAFISYGSKLYHKFGVYTRPTFKICVTKTVCYTYQQTSADPRARVEEVVSRVHYKILNREFRTTLVPGRLARSYGLKRHHSKVISSLLAAEYRENIDKITRLTENIFIPTLFLTSSDNGLCRMDDLNILEAVRNPNIVHYVSPSGGYSTFLSGFIPRVWFVAPILEFLDTLSSRCGTFPGE